jgi:hypothetical protein
VGERETLIRFLRNGPRYAGAAKPMAVLRVTGDFSAAGEDLAGPPPGVDARLPAGKPRGADSAGLLAAVAGD